MAPVLQFCFDLCNSLWLFEKVFADKFLYKTLWSTEFLVCF
jgi:hypothetical protein